VLRHIAMFRFQPGTTDDQVRQLADGLRELPAQIPEIRAYEVGPDAGLRDGNHEFAIVADFDDVESWRRYVDHPVHQQVIADRITPIVAERVAIQYEW
jgi:hypothetical protein